MTRRIASDRAFNPALVATRMRRGLWVDGTCTERSVSEMDIKHIRGTYSWILDNVRYYGALLILHPDGGTVARGVYVSDSNLKLSNLNHLTSLVKNTKLMRDLEKAIQSASAVRPIVVSTPVRLDRWAADNALHDVSESARTPVNDVVAAVLRSFEPKAGEVSVLELDDGTKITIGNGTVRVDTRGGSSILPR